MPTVQAEPFDVAIVGFVPVDAVAAGLLGQLIRRTAWTLTNPGWWSM